MNNQISILKTHELEVIGQGGMVNKPCQIGEWWVMPAEQYTDKIPSDVLAKWDNFKALNIPVLGYLIADDMRDVLIRREKEAEEQRERDRQTMEKERAAMELRRQEIEKVKQAEERKQLEEEWRQQDLDRKLRKEENEKAMRRAAVTGELVLAGIAKTLGALAIGVMSVPLILFNLIFDPVLIAVLPDGRWICVAAWWN